MLFWGQLSRENLLFGEEDEDEVEDEQLENCRLLRPNRVPKTSNQVEATTHVTYCLTGDEEGEGCPKEPGSGHIPGHDLTGPSAPPSVSSYPSTCCHAPTSAFYAILGLSRCWWQYAVTSSPGGDAMEEGVATETRGGATTGPEVTGVGWSLPCSLSSLLAMNCRARAEELARRLQSKVKVGEGGHQALEHTSLVSPTAVDGPYSSMECRHSSLDEPYLGHLEEHNLRPIHVVTSEPTLHLHLPPPPTPPLKNMREQDSDVYYDFDLASPDDIVAEEEEEEEENGHPPKEGKSHSFANGDRPESGCVTSVTSPLMFDDEGDEVADGDDAGNLLGVSRDHYSPHDSMMCSPDTDLMAVRNILSATSSLQEMQGETFKPRQRFSGKYAGGDEGTGGSGDTVTDGVVGNGEIKASCDKLCNSDMLSCGWDEEHRDVEGDDRSGAESRGNYSRSDSAFSEGATDGVDKWHRHHHTHEHHESWSGLVTMPVANSGSCWCHTAEGTEPASSHLPTSPEADDSATTAVPDLVSSEQSESVIGHNVEDASGMTDDEDTERYANRKGLSGGRDTTSQGSRVSLDSSPTHGRERRKAESHLSSGTIKQEELLGASEKEEKKQIQSGREEEAKEEKVAISKSSVEEEAAAATSVAPESISGTTPPLLPEPHLYVPSEGQPAVMEARSGSEGDLRSGDEVFSADFDNEEIETLGVEEEGSDNEEEEEENEEDIEEEAILTGKFRNIRQYTERVRRLSDDIEDRPPPPVEVKLEEEAEEPKRRGLSDDGGDDDQTSVSDLSSQVAQIDIDVEIEPPEDDPQDEEEEVTPSDSRSSSEETDPTRIENFKMRIKRSSSLKCGKTPPGTPGRKKIVRFADVLGLDLAAVRTFLAGVPHVPRSAFWDLEIDREAAAKQASSTTANPAGGAAPLCVPRRVLTPLFQQPGSHPDFIDRVRHHKVVVENVMVGDDMSVKGVIRVLSMDFHKHVCVRYTFDQWRNFHEATATYVPNSHDGATDRFSFLLWGSFLQDNGALAFCVRYSTLNQEFWDNNFGRNYTLQCYTSLGMVGDPGTNSARPQNSTSVQQFMQGTQNTPSPSPSYINFGSPVTPSDPWATRFF